jgi:peptidoglycan/xylan/chitin deacetylase (PgdA/CDA1 family)
MRKYLFLLIFIIGCNSVENSEHIIPPIIVMTFDDGHKSIYELAFPLMKKKQFVGVNFIPTGIIGQPEIMNLEEVIELENHGWETGGHTVNHANLTTISIDSAHYEIKNNFEQLKAWGLKHNCFALPAGHSNSQTDKIIKEYFKIIRTSQNERYRPPLNLDRLGYYEVHKTDDINSLLMRIDHGILEGECLIIFGFHRFCYDDPKYSTEMKLSTFQQLLEVIRKRNLHVATLTDAVQKINK